MKAAPWKERWYRIIFEADTPAGKAFDLVLLVLILLSILFVMLESLAPVNEEYGRLLRTAEWIITGAFTLEYFFRILIFPRPGKYIFSFYGIIDLLAVLPTYLGLLFVGTQSLVVVRALRLLRIFRILKLNRYTREGSVIMRALYASRQKISVFLFGVFTVVIIIGTLMYLIEGKDSGFSSIPKGIYWAIVTLTTVGYGDIAPSTALGQFIASFVMILGYAIIAVPTGIVTAELTSGRIREEGRRCEQCGHSGHEAGAGYCSRCGSPLPPGTVQ